MIYQQNIGLNLDKLLLARKPQLENLIIRANLGSQLDIYKYILQLPDPWPLQNFIILYYKVSPSIVQYHLLV